MPKMIKVTYSRPSEDIAWPYPLTNYTDLAEDIKTSHATFKAGINYASAPADASIKIQTVTNSPNNLSMERYMWFSDYPETTPTQLETWMISKIRGYEATVADANITGTNPDGGASITVSYNKGNRWVRDYQRLNNISISSVEEVDHEFPSE